MCSGGHKQATWTESPDVHDFSLSSCPQLYQNHGWLAKERKSQTLAYRWIASMGYMLVFPQNAYVEALTPSVIVWGGRSLWEVIEFRWVKVSLRGGRSQSLSLCQVRIESEGSCLKARKRALSKNWIYEKISVYCLSYRVHSILL